MKRILFLLLISLISTQHRAQHFCEYSVPDISGITTTSIQQLMVNSQTLETLKKQGITFDAINKKNAKGHTPLHRAVLTHNTKLVEALLAAGADINAQTDLGATALHWACITPNLTLVKLLIAAGAQVNIQNKSGYTPLHIAIYRPNFAVIQALLAARANPTLPGNNGKSPVDLAHTDSTIPLRTKQLLKHATENWISLAKREKEDRYSYGYLPDIPELLDLQI